MMVRGSIRSWTWSETVGTSKEVLGLAGPVQLRVKVGVVGVGARAGVGVGIGRHQADGRVVDPLLAGVLVGFNRAFGFG